MDLGEEQGGIGVELAEAEWEFEGFGCAVGLAEFEEDVCLEDGVGGFLRALSDDLVEEGGGLLLCIEALEALGDSGFPLGDIRLGDLGEAVGLEGAGVFLVCEAAVA